MPKSVALIDPVGAKAGMDYYDLFLSRALSDKGFRLFLLSNFMSDESKVIVKNIFQNSTLTGLPSALKIFKGLVFSVLFIRRQKVNWVILHIFRGDFIELFTSFISKLFGFKVLLIIHDVESLDTKKSHIKVKWVLEKFHDVKIVHNKFSMEELEKKISRAAGKNIHIISHGNFIGLIQTKKERTQAIKHFNLDANKKYILFFGQIKKIKGLDLLIEAFQKSRNDLHLIIAGKLRDDNWDRYQKLIDDLQLHGRIKTFIRHIADDERELLFKIAHAVILPYHLIYQSGVLLMAMSFGKTVIASDLPPFEEIIQHGSNGLLFAKNDPDALALILDQVFDGKFDLEKIGSEAKKFVDKNFSWSAIAEEYARLLN